MTWNLLPQNLIQKMNMLLEDLKKYDVDTYNHCVRVSQLCRFLAEADGLNEYDQLQAQFAGLLHDVGKMKIPIEVLKKPGKLTEEEYDLVKNHALYSAELLEPMEDHSFFREIQLIVLHHHERYDAKGYPMELEGEQIPYISRLILIVDTVDAMTHSRAYRKGLPMEVAFQELEKFSGSQFDPGLVKVFVSAYKKFLAQEESSTVVSLPKVSRVTRSAS